LDDGDDDVEEASEFFFSELCFNSGEVAFLISNLFLVRCLRLTFGGFRRNNFTLRFSQFSLLWSLSLHQNPTNKSIVNRKKAATKKKKSSENNFRFNEK
jgi:hypothetical protein